MRASFSSWCCFILVLLTISQVQKALSMATYSGPLPSNRSSAVNSEVKVTVTPGAMSLTPDQMVSTMLKGADEKTTAQWSLGMNIQDTRGTGVGWIISASLEHLTTLSSLQAAAHNTSPLLGLSPSFRYTGSWGESKEGPCTIRITITTPGQVGDAKFAAQIRGGSHCIAADLTGDIISTLREGEMTIGNNRLKVSFPPGSYIYADHYEISFDMIDYHECSLNPQPVQGQQQSSPAGIQLAAPQYFKGNDTRSQAIAVTTAPIGKGIGSFQQKIMVSCQVHGNPLPGRYRGTMQFMIY